MKKSEIYKIAQKAILSYDGLNIDQLLEILRELMRKEDLEAFNEKQEAEK